MPAVVEAVVAVIAGAANVPPPAVGEVAHAIHYRVPVELLRQRNVAGQRAFCVREGVRGKPSVR